MKRLLCSVLALLVIASFSSCGISADNIGKTANSAMTVATELTDIFAARKKTGYDLYGIKMLVNSENVGTYSYFYTNKRADEVRYSDILVVEINNRTGKIERFSAPDYDKHGTEPYDLISTAMPIYPQYFGIDSTAAIKKAENEHFGNHFSYNYIETTVCYKDGMTVYDIDHISLINNCIYNTVIDTATGNVLDSSVKELG